MTDRKKPTRRKTRTTFDYEPDVLKRARAYAEREHRSLTNALNVLLDAALAHAGYPPTEAPQDTAGPKG